MDNFSKKVIAFQQRYFEIKDHIGCIEEQTKRSLIVPFFEIVLGWDMSNPLECRAEYNADLRGQKNVKVDYALMIDEKPSILIEAKAITENIQNHVNQLKYYFTSVVGCRIGILTNGRYYYFYTDLDKENLMDDDPFYVLDLENITESDIKELKQFCRSHFDEKSIYQRAEHIKHLQQAKDFLLEQLQYPSDELVSIFLKSIAFEGIKTPKVKNQYREYLIESFNHILDDKYSEKRDNERKRQNMNQSIEKIEPTVKESLFFDNYKVSDLTKEDIQSFQGKKVTHIIIDGRSYSVVSWKDFFIVVLNDVIQNNHFHYIEENKILYEKLCPNKREKKPIALRSPKTLNNGVQVETNCSAPNLLSKIKQIAECSQIDISFVVEDK